MISSSCTSRNGSATQIATICGIERIGLELRVVPRHHRHRVGRDGGGYYLLWLREKMPFLFEEMP
jgi:hypothetical protein